MLRTLIEHAGFAQLYESAQQAAGSKADKLAALPSAINHMASELEGFLRRRPHSDFRSL